MYMNDISPAFIILVIVVVVVFFAVALFGRDMQDWRLFGGAGIKANDKPDEVVKKVLKAHARNQKIYNIVAKINDAFDSWWLPAIVTVAFAIFAYVYVLSIG